MEKLYAHYPFTLELNANIDISGALSTAIRIRKPGAAETDLLEIAASIIDPVEGILEAKVIAAQNDLTGKWAAWTYVVFANGDDQVGVPFNFEMYAEGY